MQAYEQEVLIAITPEIAKFCLVEINLSSVLLNHISSLKCYIYSSLTSNLGKEQTIRDATETVPWESHGGFDVLVCHRHLRENII